MAARHPTAFAFVGALVASRHPQNPIGWIFCGGAVAFSLSGLGEASTASTRCSPSRERCSAAARRQRGSRRGSGAWADVPLVGLLFPLLSRTDSCFRGAGESSPWTAFAASRSWSSAACSRPVPWRNPSTEVENPYGCRRRPATSSKQSEARGWLLIIISLIASAISLVMPLPSLARHRAAAAQVGRGRVLVAWLLVVSFTFRGAMREVMIRCGRGARLGILTMVVAAGIAILRYRLYDIDIVINRTLVYGALTAMLARVYLGSVLLLQLAAAPADRELEPGDRRLDTGRGGALRPGTCAIQAAVDRRFYRRKYDAAAHARALSQRGSATRSTSRR